MTKKTSIKPVTKAIVKTEVRTKAEFMATVKHFRKCKPNWPDNMISDDNESSTVLQNEIYKPITKTWMKNKADETLRNGCVVKLYKRSN